MRSLFSEEYRREMDQVVLTTQEKEAILQALGEEKPMRTGKFTFKAVLIAAILCVAMIVSALAVELTVGWESFLGRTPQKAVTTVGESAVTGDYTLTLQEAIVDDDGAAFLLALTRNDGGVLEGKPEPLDWDIKVEGEFPNMSMGSQQPIRSEDGKIIYYCFEFEAQGEEWDEDRVTGKTITFQCDGVADADWTEEEIEQIRRETVSLAPLAQTVRRLDVSSKDLYRPKQREELVPLVEELSAQATIPLTKKGEGKVWVSAVLISDDALPIVVVHNDRSPVRQGQYLISNGTALTLTDTRTGEQWGCTGFTWQGDDEGFYLCDFQDCPITEDTLPYFEVTVDYGTQKLLSDEPVDLSFVADDSYQTTVALDESITFNYIGDCTAHVTGASISALRLELTFDQMERSGWNWENHPQKNTPWALVNKDGTRVLLFSPMIRQDEETGAGYIRLGGVDENNDRRLIDPDQVEALMVGGTVIPLK